jgi:hypothetical protein
MGQKDKSFCTCLDRGHYEATGKQKGNGSRTSGNLANFSDLPIADVKVKF